MLYILTPTNKITININSKTTTVKDLKIAFSKVTSINIHQLSFKFQEIRLDSDSKSLASFGIVDGSQIHFKDLGPQIGYRTVFIVEYLGPMVFVLLYALRPTWVFGPKASLLPFNPVAQLGVGCWVLHFLKREFETFFVHKFSRPTMPLSNLFKNCAYYWIFGAVIGYPLCHPAYVPPSAPLVWIGLSLFSICEVGNFICHYMLSNMRPKEGSQDRAIPRGFLFDLVACPNYTFEVFSWVGFSIMTQIPFAYAFTLVGLMQMGDWAMKKHQGYKETYGKEYTKLGRKAIIPFVY